MNRAVVIRSTRGLADYLLSNTVGNPPCVVVGRDARPTSEAFMRDVIGVFLAAGLTVEYFPEPIPTPIVAYATLSRGAHAAVVITASHNPLSDNGYKVYGANGAQIIPPSDRYIAEAIAAVGPAIDVPRVEDFEEHERSRVLDDAVFDRYLGDMELTRVRPVAVPSFKIAYTPLHGVGGKYVVAALAHAGYVDVHLAGAQFDPDGTFPTVRFPNPEEPGALNLVYDLASRVDADLVIANDPDADRLAIGLPSEYGWSALTGNQIGVLLADHLLENTKVENPVVVSSVVSSPMLGVIAAFRRARFAQSLTGFKWIWNAGLELESAGGTFVFGYEEALGYSIGRAVHDKDGISAAVAFADLVAACVVEGMTVADRLEALYRKHALWVSSQANVVCPGLDGASKIEVVMNQITMDPPQSLSGVEITSVIDYSVGAETRPRYLPAAKLVELELGELGRLLIRPSGTEPKLKIYGDLQSDVSKVADMRSAEKKLLDRIDKLISDLIDYLRLD